MADETDNLPVSIYGGDAVLGSDIFTNNGETAHAQIYKAAWGDDNYTYKTNASTPFPVRIYGSSGDTNRVVVTGGVFGLGAFSVSNSFANPLYVASGTGGTLNVSAIVQGMTNGIPVGITGSVYILGNVGITGLVSVTGGRALTFGSDSIRVFGEIGTTRGWKLTAANDTVTVSPIAGGFTHATYLVSSNNTTLGSSGDSLKVHITNTGFTLTANISPEMYVRNATGDIFRIQGTTWISETNPSPVVVRGTKAYSSANSGLEAGDMIVSFLGSQSVQITNTPNIDVTKSSNLYNSLYGSSDIGSTGSIGGNVASIQSSISNINTKISNIIPAKIRNETTLTGSLKNWFINLNASENAKSVANPNDQTLVPVQGTHIKNLTYLRSAVDPPPVTIALGTRTNGVTGPSFNLSLYLDPGESIFIPMAVSGLYAQIVAKSVSTGFSNQTYQNALGIMSI